MEFAFAVLAVVFSSHALLLIHELGHYWMARALDIPVTEVSSGIGWRIVSCKRDETVFNLRLLPIAGYCKLDMEFLGPFESIAILLGGPILSVMFGVACMILGIALALTSTEMQPHRLTAIQEIKQDETRTYFVLSLERSMFPSIKEVGEALSSHEASGAFLFDTKQKAIVTRVVSQRNTELKVLPEQEVDIDGIARARFIGISHPIHEARWESSTIQRYRIMPGVISLLRGIYYWSRVGAGPVTFWFGAFSLALGLGNLMPLPPLDGGRVALQLFRVFGRWLPSPEEELDEKNVENTSLTVVAVICAFTAYTTIFDILEVMYSHRVLG